MVGGACWWGLVYKKCSGGRGPAGRALFTRSVVVGGGCWWGLVYKKCSGGRGLLVGPCLQEV